jgi:DNA-binding transcriptional LysR family regulator
MLDLQKLETFRMVAVTSNFSRAAAQLGYHQSTVTFHIKSLERELGVRLFERHRFSRTISMTDVGRHTFEYAERLLALATEAKAKAVSFARKRSPRGLTQSSPAEGGQSESGQ